jgi:GT2 family glycosyltransferase/lipopolysaccharide/colanic/teichoic acid biosynthesis glycosyltransferase
VKVDISIVIVNYNVKAFLEQCLMAIQRAVHEFTVEVFVVDNASVDGSQAMVKKKFPHVHLIENRKNIGFSRANNLALRQARGRHVLLLNPDTLIQENTLIVLKEYLDAHSEVGAAGVKLLNPDGSFQLGSRRGLPTPWVAFTRIIGLSRLFPRSRIFGRYNMTFLDPDTEADIDVLTGSLMYARRSILDEIGYFDEDYFMYGEDVDLCYRIKQAGWRIVYIPKTQAIHYKGESTKKGEMSFVTHFYNAMLIFSRKHFNTRYSLFLRLLLTLGIFGRAAISYLWRLIKYIASPVLDLTLIVLSIYIAIIIWLPEYALERFRVVLPIYTFIWFVSIYFSGAYHKKRRYRLKPILGSSITGLLINSTLTYFFKQFAYSRVVVLISFVLITLSLSLWRFLYRFIGPMAKKSPLARVRRAVIIGAGKEGKRILKKLQKRPDMQYEVCGFVDFDEGSIGKTVDGAEVVATIDNIREVIRVERINDVIFSSDRLTNAQILETIVRAQGSGVNFRIVPHELEYIVAKSSVDEIEEIPLLDIAGVADPLDLMIKRVSDIFIAAIAVVFTSPLLLLNVMAGGRLQKRVIIGQGGNPVEVSVFDGGIRSFRNVPLYFSIFTGKLSLVGSEMQQYTPHEQHATYKPGLTGLVQLKSREKQKALTREEKDYYNLYYVKNQSLITDLQIVLKSFL